MTVPFLDLAAHHRPFADRFAAIFADALASSAFIGGEYVSRFEQNWSRACEVEHTVGVANGTDAIEIALGALGIGEGDEVIVPTNTFVATAAAVLRAGAQPVFCDVEPDTLLISPSSVAEAMGPRVVAVIAVHLFGQPANMTELTAFASRHQIALIEDAAQAHCATWNGQPVGSFGDVATFSFYPGKNLGALGDGGAISTNDLQVAQTCRELANHGRSAADPMGHSRVGRNSRLDGIQAAFLDVKLEGLSEANNARRTAHRRYTERLPANVHQVAVDPRSESVHHLEVVRCEHRDMIRQSLTDRGIGTGIHYLAPCHALAPFQDCRRVETPVADIAAGEILSLPMYPELGDEQVAEVCAALETATDVDMSNSVSHRVGS